MTQETADPSNRTAQDELVTRYLQGRLADSVYDELIDADGTVRAVWRDLTEPLAGRGSAGLSELTDRVERLIDNDGVTYNPVIQVPAVVAAPVPWRLDPVPMLLAAEDWDVLEEGLLQRSRLLDALLGDIYGPMETVRRGLLPPELVFGHPGYLRAAHGIPLPERCRLFLHGCDIGRGHDGRFRVGADRAQAPSGAGYALADRRVMARAIPEVFEHAAPRPLTSFVRALRAALIESASEQVEQPTVVVLSPGTHSETAFDQAYLASVLGFPLVESADLTVREGKLWMRALGALERVDVVLRRVDAEYADPLDLRPDSQLGVVGLVEVLRRGAVSVVNTLGSGVLENPALQGFLPEMCRALLDEDLQLDSVPSYWGGDPLQRTKLLADLPGLVLKPITGEPSIDGSRLTTAERTTLAARIEAEGWKWVGQEPLPHTLSPAASNGSSFGAVPCGLRTFTVAQGAGYTAMVGGLGQVLRRDGAALVSESYAAKDVWVRAGESATRAEPVRVPVTRIEELPAFEAPDIDVLSSPRVLADLFWMGRYAERAEGTARLLIAARERFQDFRFSPWRDGYECVPVLLGAITGTEPSGERNPITAARTQIRALTVDKARSGSLAESLEHLGHSARAVRDQLSNDTWMVLGAVERALAEFAASGASDEAGLAGVHSTALAGMLALSGLSAESMVHDTGWYVTDIGKRIERGLQLTGLLAATLTRELPSDAEAIVTEAVLVASESSVIFRRRNRTDARLAAAGRARIAGVAQLLLFDDGNPRSLVFQLEALRRDLRALPEAEGSPRAERIVDEASARLRRADPEGLETLAESGTRADLAELLDAMQSALRTLSDVFTDTRLSLPGEIQPLWGAGPARLVP
ncbi:circularly permuted type 2 ATP-grasp protein [Aldersonia kunmingensis]|uniref:circularly permuted type 2 ATP-grasp protein n=1 Tax=Aldersonia kunmingensis TaxID=408066 RepID=UPI0009FC5F75|nr:circularly permuted type 2 ATP-grasp protein [Aldersonia kunmingensis]